MDLSARTQRDLEAILDILDQRLRELSQEPYSGAEADALRALHGSATEMLGEG